MLRKKVVGGWVNRLEHHIAPSRRVARTAALVRNQCEIVIGYHLAPSSNAEQNGESWLLDAVGPTVERFMDVGANVGNWTAGLLARNPGAEGIAIEPGTEALKRLRARVPETVTVVPAAAGGKEGTTSFFEQPDAGEHSSIIAAWGERVPERTVKVVTVDALLRRQGWDRLDYLKIDTEGYDGHALDGAAQALRDHRIGFVQFEYNRPWRVGGKTLGGVLQSLASFGYVVYVVRKNGPEPYQYEPFGEFFSYSNFVAVSPSSQAMSGVREW